MAQNTLSNADSPRRRSGLLRDQVQLVKRSASARYEIVPIQDQLSFEKGFFIVIRACQLLVQKNEGIVLVGVAGPSGAGKSVFTEKILNVMPSIAIINMDNYNEPSRIVDGNFDGNNASVFLNPCRLLHEIILLMYMSYSCSGLMQQLYHYMRYFFKNYCCCLKTSVLW